MKIFNRLKSKKNLGAWKTIHIESPGKISLSANQMVLEYDKQITYYPLADVDLITIANSQLILTYPFLVYCMEQHIRILIHNRQYLWVGSLTPQISHHQSFDKMRIQFNWNKKLLDWFWQHIVANKIQNQINVIQMLKINVNDSLLKLRFQIDLGDTMNHEGQAAKIYFRQLFGSKFKRFNDDEINHALNYGYSILHGIIQRQLTILGYQTQIGIHHKSKANLYNLSYDLIEPFRPLVDYQVSKHQGITFKKKILQDIFTTKIKYGSKKYLLKDAILNYVQKTINYIDQEIKEYLYVEF
jgi:CRISPR-associated endonuclease Cas1 subtype II